MKYVQMTEAGWLHMIGDKEFTTKCGRNFRRYDCRFFDVVDTHHALCHKCSGQRRIGPRTIREAFQPGSYESR